MQLDSRTLSHLQQLEAESIHIIREAAAEFEKPVMLYSIGKDSSVLLRLAVKAFAPGRIPFPLLHVDTTWKFQEMIRFRAEMQKLYDFELLVHTNPLSTDDDPIGIAAVRKSFPGAEYAEDLMEIEF